MKNWTKEEEGGKEGKKRHKVRNYDKQTLFQGTLPSTVLGYFILSFFFKLFYCWYFYGMLGYCSTVRIKYSGNFKH